MSISNTECLLRMREEHYELEDYQSELLKDSLKRARAALRVDGEVLDCCKRTPAQLLKHAWPFSLVHEHSDFGKLKIVFCRCTERSYQFVKFLNGLPSSLRAIACVSDIWASRSKRNIFRLGDCDATYPKDQVAVVLPMPPLKLIVAIVFRYEPFDW